MGSGGVGGSPRVAVGREAQRASEEEGMWRILWHVSHLDGPCLGVAGPLHDRAAVTHASAHHLRRERGQGELEARGHAREIVRER